MPKIRVCNNEEPIKDCKKFDSYSELIEWAKEEKNKEIKVGDIVTIENYGDMYDTLDVPYFKNLCDDTDIDVDEIYKIMIHYDYGRNYGVGINPLNREEYRVKWKVLFIYDNHVFIGRHDTYIGNDYNQILCIKKEGLKKYEEVKRMPRIRVRVCNNEEPIKDCKKFDSYEDLIKWASDEKNKEIKVGDKVRIIDTGYKYSSLPSGFFNNVYFKSPLTSDEILHIVRHYNTRTDENYDGDFGIVEYIWEDKIFIRHQDFYNHDYIIIGKEGVEKC